MCRWETGLKSRRLYFVFSGKSLPLLSGQVYVQHLLLGCGKERPFIFKSACIPLGQFEAITSDSTMSYGPVLLQEKHGEECSLIRMGVGETGISHNRQSWQERERRGEKETTEGNQDTEKGWDQSTEQRKCRRVACVGLCTVCVQTHQGTLGSVTRRG